MTVLFNEWDRPTASWLSRLSQAGHLPAGTVDTRSITDLTAEDVKGFSQVHFFSGIGGWPLALRWAGLEGVSGIWTGSPPCQPFSVAGRKKGYADERHLAPVWLRLVCQCRPAIVFGEQVAAAIKKGWLDDLFAKLEAGGYACGAAVLPACSVGAPHLRNRLFFGAVRMADMHSDGRLTGGALRSVRSEYDVEYGREASVMGHSNSQHEPPARSGAWGQYPCGTGQIGNMADADCSGPQRRKFLPKRTNQQFVGQSNLAGRSAHPYHGFWNAADWLGCRDGRLRPVEPGTFPLADGIPARVGRLRGYGNAVVPQVAAVFVKSFMEAAKEIAA